MSPEMQFTILEHFIYAVIIVAVLYLGPGKLQGIHQLLTDIQAVLLNIQTIALLLAEPPKPPDKTTGANG